MTARSGPPRPDILYEQHGDLNRSHPDTRVHRYDDAQQSFCARQLQNAADFLVDSGQPSLGQGRSRCSREQRLRPGQGRLSGAVATGAIVVDGCNRSSMAERV